MNLISPLPCNNLAQDLQANTSTTTIFQELCLEKSHFDDLENSELGKLSFELFQRRDKCSQRTMATFFGLEQFFSVSFEEWS